MRSLPLQALSTRISDSTKMKLRLGELEAALSVSEAEASRHASHSAMMSKTVEVLEARLEQQRQELCMVRALSVELAEQAQSQQAEVGRGEWPRGRGLGLRCDVCDMVCRSCLRTRSYH